MNVKSKNVTNVTIKHFTPPSCTGTKGTITKEFDTTVTSASFKAVHLGVLKNINCQSMVILIIE